MTKKVRVRFAPSPTGHLHIGGLRTALFNLLFARHFQGDFLVRIEDTDPERSFERFTQEIISSLEWADIVADESIVIQSQKIHEHEVLIEQLLSSGKAYRCYCVTNSKASKETYFKYDGKCRTRNDHEPGKSFVVRIKLPLGCKKIIFNDLIRGPIEFDLNKFDDFIIVRSDGTPMYNFVVVADDASMGITHILRGEDHIPNTPKQIVIYEALGLDVPKFAHLPLILGAAGQKLSKRDAAVAVIDYKKKGYLPQALCNYLVRLGWAYGDKEIFSRQKLIELFSLEDVGKKGAIFDIDKLDWVNGIYIRKQTAQELFVCIDNDVEPGWRLKFTSVEDSVFYKALDVYKERVLTLRQLVDEVSILFIGPNTYNKEDLEKYIESQTFKYIKHAMVVLNKISVFSSSELQRVIQQLAKELSIPLVKLAQPMRIALLGKTSSPGIFDILSLIGKKETFKRLAGFENALSNAL